jgi:ribosome production factor 2
MSSFIRKPKTRRGKKFLEARAPKVTENDKTTLLLKGGKTTEMLTDFLTDIYQLKKPSVEKLKQWVLYFHAIINAYPFRKNPVHLFEDCTFIEKMGQKYDASLFAMISNSKKRPDTVTIGRLFDSHLLDMVELKLVNFKPTSEFKVSYS